MEDFACGIAILAILGYALNFIAWIFKDIEIKGGFFDFIIGFLCGLFSFALIGYGLTLSGCGETLALIIGGIIGFIIFSIYINIRHKFSTNLIVLSALLVFYYYGEIDSAITAKDSKKEEVALKEEIIIPADTSIHKITPINEDKFKKTTNKTIAKRNKKSSIKNTTPNETIEEKIEVKDVNHIIDENKIYNVVEEMPNFPGGSSALFEYLNKNIHYPVVAEENGVQGRAVVTFVVECDGSISNAKVVKSVDPSLDIEAKRIVMSMPHWIPAKQNGIAVRCRYTIPVTFRLC